MKKLILSIAMVGTLAFAACSIEDAVEDAVDQLQGELSCETCELSSISTQYCDNGDGTIEVTVSGVSTDIDLNGTSFDDYIAVLEASGATCN